MYVLHVWSAGPAAQSDTTGEREGPHDASLHMNRVFTKRASWETSTNAGPQFHIRLAHPLEIDNKTAANRK
jgi:hypothetical protein